MVGLPFASSLLQSRVETQVLPRAEHSPGPDELFITTFPYVRE